MANSTQPPVTMANSTQPPVTIANNNKLPTTMADGTVPPEAMADDTEQTVFIYHQYFPAGVKEVIASGTSAFIGEVDESTVLKYPLGPGGDMSRLKVERDLLEIIGPHERVIGLRGFSDTGIYLERLTGNVADYILDSDHPSPSLKQRLTWCRESAEAVAFIHTRNVIHCDIQPTNLLLDKGLHIKLSDFQGKHLSEDGEVLLDGWSSEPCRFYCPRDDPFDADIKTDIFALGCTMYFIMMGQAVFPDIINGEDEWRERVEDRFKRGQFPQDQHACSTVILRCWQKEYNTAQEIVQDINSLLSNPKLSLE